jgi:hypothetical protein
MSADLFGYERPALGRLITAMVRLPPRQRQEIARMGRRAKAAKRATIRRLAREAAAEARRMAALA